MPEDINKRIVQEKNKLASSGAWVWLIDVYYSGASCVHLVNNLENVTYFGTEYVRCNFKFGQYSRDEAGKLSEISLDISNTELVTAILPYVDDYDGLVGCTIVRTPVNTKWLIIDMTAKQEEFIVKGCSAGEEWISFLLGAPSPLNKRFPKSRFFGNYCRYVGQFKGIECGYSGAETSCNGTPEDCEDNKNNLARFGGQQGLRNKTIRFA